MLAPVLTRFRIVEGTRRTPFSRGAVILVAGLGVLAFVLSAFFPDDDAFQQECFRGKTSLQALAQHTRRNSGGLDVRPVPKPFCAAPRAELPRRCQRTEHQYVALTAFCPTLPSPVWASRAPPLTD
jgi:hypothetical protein